MPIENTAEKDHKGQNIMPSIEDPELYDAYLRSLYKIETLHTQTSVDNLGLAYQLFKRNWSDNVMTWISACKTIVLGKDKQPLSLIYFEPDGRINKDHISKLFEIIKENFDDVSSIMFAVNNPVNPFEAGEKEQTVISYFKECSVEAKTKITAKYMISPLGMNKLTSRKSNRSRERGATTRPI